MYTSKEDLLLLAEIEDKMIKSRYQGCISHSGFLDMRQRSEVSRAFGCRFWGGYEDAERTIAVFLPDGYTAGDASPFPDEEDDPLAVIRVSTGKAGRPLTHRDYLGSLLSLGLERSVVGDIIVKEHGADIVVMKSISGFIIANYEKAGRSGLNCSLHPCRAIDTGVIMTKEKRDGVASLRLDRLVSSAFGLSRGKAQESIKQGLVFADSVQMTKQDAVLGEGCRLVLRGKGKAVLRTVGSPTRKDRFPLTWDIYI